MFSKYKYNHILELEKKYKDSFWFNKTKRISILPPVLKKIGLRYFLAFLVISQPKENESHKGITRPIGVLLKQKNGRGSEKIFDMKNYEFCPKRSDFDLEYYSLEMHPGFWPNRTLKNEENYRISLEILLKINRSVNFFKGPNKKDYKKYLKRIKEMFPVQFHIFFDSLQNNKILSVGREIKIKRKKAKIDHTNRLTRIREKLKTEKELNKQRFFEKVKSTIISYVKKEALDAIKLRGSYSKLLFYEKIGTYIKDFKKDLEKYLDCFDPLLTPASLQKNTEQVLERCKLDIIKIYLRACNNVLCKIVIVDTLSKVLIVFLNAMLIEEIQNQITKQSEHEIEECKLVFKEDIEKVKNVEAKEFLTKIYNDLLKDYYTFDEENLSDIYYAYSAIHKTRPILSLVD